MNRWLSAFFLLGSLAFAGDYSEITTQPDSALKELKLFPAYLRDLPPPFTDASGFVVGGPNATALIRTIGSIGKNSIAVLEASMRPGALSGEGFLGKNESLLEVLAIDNDVVQALGHTHRAIGYYLRVLGELGVVPDHEDFTYRGERFSVVRGDTHGLQESPFEDGTRDGRNARLTNLRTGDTISYALLVPRMVERYGFYEGHGTNYRVDPAKAVQVLGTVLTVPPRATADSLAD